MSFLWSFNPHSALEHIGHIAVPEPVYVRVGTSARRTQSLDDTLNRSLADSPATTNVALGFRPRPGCLSCSMSRNFGG